MEKLFIASKNAHKVEEFRSLLRDFHMDVQRLPETLPDCPENGVTFESNAMEKAAFYAEHCDGWVLADDSGLCVSALNGDPGVLSARYAGVHGDSEANNVKLLNALTGVPYEARTARFVCVLALYHRGRGEGLIVRAEVNGYIADAPSGNKGFGYDPLFFVPEHGCTYADLSNDVKNEVSHRAKAIKLLFDLWRRTSPCGSAS